MNGPPRPAGPPREGPSSGGFEPRLAETLEALAGGGFAEAEAYAKRGRSRRLLLATDQRSGSFHDERGWAVRAATARASLFACGTGDLDPGTPWPQPDGLPLPLPDPDAGGAAAAWSEPSDYESPLIGETEGLRLLDAVERALDDEMPHARLLAAHLEDGSSDSRLANRRGVAARWRLRVAVLRAEAAAGGARVSVELAAREARRFGPAAVARQLADRLTVAAAGTPEGFTGRDRGELLLAPAVAARLLAALAPLLVGPAALRLVAPLRDRRGRVAADRLSIVDDGRLPGGVLEAPVDGEGMPTRAVTLIEAGTFRQPLLSWRDAREIGDARARPSGCARRASWRDVPATAPGHLYVVPDPAVPPTDLLADLARGYYLLDTAGEPAVDWRDGTFRVPVLGFSVQGGRARAPVAGVWLAGSLRALLGGVQGVGRDLTFFPYDGMIGAPSLRLTGLELRARG